MALSAEERILVELRTISRLLETLIEYHARNSHYGVASRFTGRAQTARSEACLELADVETE